MRLMTNREHPCSEPGSFTKQASVCHSFLSNSYIAASEYGYNM